MKLNRIDFLGIPVDALTMNETINLIDESISLNKHIDHTVINAWKVVAMQNDKQLLKSVITCDIINADGQSIIWAARFLGKYLPERVTGIDLMQEIVKLANKRKYKCFFFGAKEEVVKKVIDIYTQQYGNNLIAGYRNGYYTKEEEPLIAQYIAESHPHILFVAITSPKKEKFLYEYKSILKNINFTMGVGGTFDVIGGVTNRAPKWMQKIGMEWLFRFIQEPVRMWKRYFIGNLRFLWLVLKEKYH